jgi:hypothetical protein
LYRFCSFLGKLAEIRDRNQSFRRKSWFMDGLKIIQYTVIKNILLEIKPFDRPRDGKGPDIWNKQWKSIYKSVF